MFDTERSSAQVRVIRYPEPVQVKWARDEGARELGDLGHLGYRV